jgi:hypothetical protein
LGEFAHQDWAKIATDIKESAVSVNGMAQSMGGWKVVIEGLIALKIAGWVLGIAASLVTVTRAAAALFALTAPAWVLPLLGLAAGLGAEALNEKMGMTKQAARSRAKRQADKYNAWGIYKGTNSPDASFADRFPGGGAFAPSSGGDTGATSKGASSSKIAITKAAMIEQLRKEGVPEANLEYAAALMTGQGMSESGLNSKAVHDGGTGYGIYGARGGRLTAMLNWLAANGYAQNSLVGQARYMVHEAMTGKSYGPTRDALLGASAANMASGTRTITRNFERPAVDNSAARLKNSEAALKARGLTPGAADTPTFNDRWDDRVLRRDKPSAGPRSSLDLLDNARRSGFGPNGGGLTGSASLTIDLNGFPRGTRTASKYDGMFKDLRLNRGRANQMAEG